MTAKRKWKTSLVPVVRLHSPGQWGVALLSPHTGDLKEWILCDTKRAAKALCAKMQKEE